jgi:hypothetical protein
MVYSVTDTFIPGAEAHTTRGTHVAPYGHRPLCVRVPGFARYSGLFASATDRTLSRSSAPTTNLEDVAR